MPISLPHNFALITPSQVSVVKGQYAIPFSWLDDNFNQLANAITVSSTAPTPSYAGQLWLDISVSPPVIKQWDGSAWQSKVSNADNADKVDNAHASLTPTANAIPIALSTGKLDTGWLHNFNQVEFTASGTWTVPSGVTKIQVVAIAGGGGGAGSVSNGTGMGGYAGSAEIKILSVSSGETLTITVGAGGSGGAQGSVGGAGGNTLISGSVSGSLLSLDGGPGGSLIGASVVITSKGQASMFGRGAPVTASPGPGAAGVSYGSGGGGANDAYAGGNGRQGFVRIIYLA